MDQRVDQTAFCGARRPARYARGALSVEAQHLIYARDAESIDARGAVLLRRERVDWLLPPWSAATVLRDSSPAEVYPWPVRWKGILRSDSLYFSLRQARRAFGPSAPA